MPQANATEVPEQATRRCLAAGELLWQAGQPADYVVWVENGVLEVVQHSLQGEDAVLSRLHAGQWAGEMSCLDGYPHSATLRAAEPTVVRMLDRMAFLAWVAGQPERCLQLLHNLSNRLRTLSARLGEVSFDPVQIRLARFLVSQPEDSLRITQQQLGEYLAATRESVTKALAAFTRAGWVRTGRGQLQILDRSALGELIHSKSSQSFMPTGSHPSSSKEAGDGF